MDDLIITLLEQYIKYFIKNHTFYYFSTSKFLIDTSQSHKNYSENEKHFLAYKL